MADSTAAHIDAVSSLGELYPLLERANFGPGWRRPEPSIWSNPRKNFVPFRWQYDEARAALNSAAKQNVDTQMAERRNLIMVNPSPGNIYATVRTLVSAYQLVLAHETARSHRHSPNALRLVLDAGRHAYTVVNGKKIPMQSGDVLLTPNWSWHGHDNAGDQDAFWIDFLDVPMVQLLEPMFFEHYPQGLEDAADIDPASPMRFAWEDDRTKLSKQAEIVPGWRTLELGPPHLDTIMLSRWSLEPEVRAAPARSTANSIFAVIEGRGSADIDGAVFAWSRGDVLAIPSWRPYSLTASVPSTLLRVSDEAMLRRLGWLRSA